MVSIYIQDADMSVLEFKIPPAEIITNIPTKHKVVESVAHGEYLIPKKRGLVEISFSTTMLHAKHYFQRGEETPKDWLLTFEKMMGTQTPLRLIITEELTNWQLNMQCLVSNFNYTRDGGIGRIQADFGFIEYKTITPTIYEVV